MECALHLAAQRKAPPAVTVVEGWAVCEECRRYVQQTSVKRPEWLLNRVVALVRER
jgi:hypothetical protein